MTKIAVPLTFLILAFLAFVIWRWQVGRQTRRREERDAQRERDQWVDRMMKGDP